MIEADARIVNRLGLHARAAARLVQTLTPYAATITIEHGQRRINAKSIMGLMLLAAARGTTLRISAEGADAEAAVTAATTLIADRFGEAD
jgi:phosphotransferase system HPr (HPr) family protein